MGDFVQLSLVTYGLHKQMKGPWLLLARKCNNNLGAQRKTWIVVYKQV